MDYKDIEQLLERYWKCETSGEEEARLRAFFTQKDVPSHLMRYKAWFTYLQQEQEEQLDKDFDARILAQLSQEKPKVVKAKRITPALRIVPLLKAVAVIAIVAGLGNIMQRSFSNGDLQGVDADTIGEQISVPSVALSKEAAACEQQLPDSLPRAKKLPKETMNLK